VSHHYYGPVYHGDRVEGDKAGGAINKDMSFSGSGPTSLGGDAVAGTQSIAGTGTQSIAGTGTRSIAGTGNR
jgi:hypothetical protein